MLCQTKWNKIEEPIQKVKSDSIGCYRATPYYEKFSFKNWLALIFDSFFVEFWSISVCFN